MSTTTTPARRQTYGGVRTPRPSIGINTRSQGAPAPSALAPAVPFDWAAARGLKGIPYATPENRRLRQLTGSSNGATPTLRGTPGSRKSLTAPHVRSVGLIERIQAWPSEIMFQLALFPHNVPLPRARTSARVLAGFAHFLHLCVRYAATSHMRDDELGWEDMLSEADAAVAVFTWTRVLNFTLVFVALVNAAYFASRTREYTHFRASEPLNTPHARFVPAKDIFQNADNSSPGTLGRIASVLWSLTKAGGRWVFGIAAPPAIEAIIDGRVVQKVDMWMPEEFEKTFFTIYSPVHAVLWMFWTPSAWLSYSFAMAILGVQLSILMTAYDGLIKDTRILQASVMAEYDLNFVQPRLNVIKRDACVQTSEAEMLFIPKERDVPRHRRRYTDFSS